MHKIQEHTEKPVIRVYTEEESKSFDVQQEVFLDRLTGKGFAISTSGNSHTILCPAGLKNIRDLFKDEDFFPQEVTKKNFNGSVHYIGPDKDQPDRLVYKVSPNLISALMVAEVQKNCKQLGVSEDFLKELRMD